VRNRRSGDDLASVSLDGLRSALIEMGRSSVNGCPATGTELERKLMAVSDALSTGATADAVAATSAGAHRHLQEWGRQTAQHFRQKAGEVKSMLLTMAQAAESVGECDQRCAQQLHAVTAQLRQIASLDDITAMRRSIEERTAELKNSIERMTENGQAVLQQLQDKVATFQAKLEEAEENASRDTLTCLRNRLCLEGQIEQRIASQSAFSVVILDIDGFKRVNDTHGHVVGDELLKQFATDLRSACRSSDIVGRWGGDEFLVLLDCDLEQAEAQISRVSKWVFGNYVVEGTAGSVKLVLTASVGIAEFTPPETIKELLDRADAAMYRQKVTARLAASA
jgi:diguanylate cyclase (GGDEF)-like protein